MTDDTAHAPLQPGFRKAGEVACDLIARLLGGAKIECCDQMPDVMVGYEKQDYMFALKCTKCYKTSPGIVVRPDDIGVRTCQAVADKFQELWKAHKADA